MQSLDIETVVVVVCCLLFYTRSSVFPVDARRLFKSSRPMSRLFEARLSAGLAGVFFWEGGQDAPDASVSLMAAARVAAEAAAEASKPEL